MYAPDNSRNPRAKPADFSQRSRVSLRETPTYSTTPFSEAPSLRGSTYAQPADYSNQPTFRPRTRHRRWSLEEELSAVLPPAIPAEQVSGPAQQQFAAPHRLSEGLQTRPERMLITSAASSHKSIIPQGTLVAGTAQPQQAGHTYSGQIPVGPHLPNSLQSQCAIVAAQQTTREQLQAWRAAGRPKCIKCKKHHAPPCSAKKVVESLARAAGMKPIAEQNAARHAPAQQKPIIHRAQIIPPPVWGDPQGTDGWPDTDTWSNTNAWSDTTDPSTPWAPLDAPVTIPAVPAQVATQLPYCPQPEELLAAWPNKDKMSPQFVALIPALFATLPPEYQSRFWTDMQERTLHQFRHVPTSSNATQQHSATNVAAPGSGGHPLAHPPTTYAQAASTLTPQGGSPDTTDWSAPRAPSALWAAPASSATVPVIPAQAASQSSWYTQPIELPIMDPMILTNTSLRVSITRGHYQQFFSRLSQEDKLRFTMAVYQGKVDQFPWNLRDRYAALQHR
jgi:hypothetical protein